MFCIYARSRYDLQEAEDRSDIDDDGKQLLSDLPGMYTKEVETNLTTDNFVNSDYDLNNEEYFSSDIFLNPTSLIEPAQKVMKNEPPISAGTSSNVSQQSSSMATAYGRCPICNKKFLFSILPEHADSCLKDKQTPFICISDSEEENDICEDYYNADDSSQLVNPEDLKNQLIKIIKTCQVDMEVIQLNIRRKFEFSDFVKFFSKSWNVKRSRFAYRINYIGEAGIDTGGVSREFYTGMIIYYMIMYYYLYTVPVHSHKVASWVIRTRTTIFVV